MPIHDWTRVPAGLFHHFHQDWSIELARRLNGGLLPKDISALVEQRARQKEAHVLAVENRVKRANRIVIKHHLSRILAVIEILSPGNKDSLAALADFVEETTDFLRNGVHVLLVNLFPPTARSVRDAQGDLG